MLIFQYFIIFFTTIISILLLRPLAFRFGLLDVPNERKIHHGSVPLIGGIGMFIGVFFGLISLNFLILEDNLTIYQKYYESFQNLYFLILSSFILIIIGIVDDFKNVSHKVRFLFQVVAAATT